MLSNFVKNLLDFNVDIDVNHYKNYLFVWNVSDCWDSQENINIKQTFQDIT
jgi:hypothetical protein